MFISENVIFFYVNAGTNCLILSENAHLRLSILLSEFGKLGEGFNGVAEMVAQVFDDALSWLKIYQSSQIHF